MYRKGIISVFAFLLVINMMSIGVLQALEFIYPDDGSEVY